MTIVSREMIRQKAQAAHARGDSRDSHGMNWGSPALSTWLHEYDRLDASARQLDANTPPWHGAPAGGARVDVAQVVV